MNLSASLPFHSLDAGPSKQKSGSGYLPFLQHWRCLSGCSDKLAQFKDLEAPNSLPSVRELESLPTVIQIGQRDFVSSLLITEDGIRDLFAHTFRILLRIRQNPSYSNTDEYLKMVSLIEFVALMNLDNGDREGPCPEEIKNEFIFGIRRLVGKVPFLSRDMLNKPVKDNLWIHITILTWNMASTVLMQIQMSCQRSSQTDDIQPMLDDVLNMIAVGCAQIFAANATSSPCQCVEGIVSKLFGDRASRFMNVFLNCVKTLAEDKELVLNSDYLCIPRTPQPIVFFEFYVNVVSHLLDTERIKADSEWTSTFLMRAFAMIGFLHSSHLLKISQTMIAFISHHRPTSFDKCKKPTKDLFNTVVQYCESNSFEELERLSRNEFGVLKWHEEVSQQFSSCCESGVSVLHFFVLLMSQECLYEACRRQIFAYFEGLRQVNTPSFSTIMSLGLGICSVVKEPLDLLNGLSNWVFECVKSPNPDMLPILINAIGAIANIAKSKGLDSEVKQNELLVNLLNKLVHPLDSELLMRIIRECGDSLSGVDFDRIIPLISKTSLILLFEHLEDYELELPRSVWNRALQLMDTEERVVNFVINQVRNGLRRSATSSESLSRLKTLLDRYNNKMDRTFLSFGRIMLQKDSNTAISLDHYVPLWILAVAQYPEGDTLYLTYSIWEALLDSVADDEKLVAGLRGRFDGPLLYLQRLIEVAGDSEIDPHQKLLKWFSPTVAKGLRELVLADGNSAEAVSSRQRAHLICMQIVAHLSSQLLRVAEVMKMRVGFNQSAFVIIASAVLDRKVLASEVLTEWASRILEGMLKCPFHMFVYNRVKMVLQSFRGSSADEEIRAVISRTPNNNPYIVHLSTKESNADLKQFALSFQ